MVIGIGFLTFCFCDHGFDSPWLHEYFCLNYDCLVEISGFLKKKSLGPKEKQCSAKEGNESRLVTKIRWAVVSVNARLKTFSGRKIQSRYTSSKKYFWWIKINNDDPHDPIVGWFCECKAGARTVGCCAHLATIIWYLGNRKHSQY